jgi:alkyl sulfatase BDS1-like metallo-beta-lactamase superfamily hydrolase
MLCSRGAIPVLSELVMADLLDLSARFIDEGVYEGPGSINRITTELSEVADGIAVIEAFSHVVAFRTGDGLAIFDTSLEAFADGILKSLRAWSDEPVHSVAYTHGHIDHVGGAQAFLDDARERGRPRPRVVGHENVGDRFARYRATNGYNAIVNARQFGGNRLLGESGSDGAPRFGPASWVQPDTTFRERLVMRVGELTFDLRHALGETNDHLWAWVPRHRAICAGDFVTWVFPNAGNPQKVQRYPLEWAAALREMAALEAELLLPAHGLPVAGAERIRRLLDDVATALESLVRQCLALMNEGASLDALLHSISLPEALLAKPYLRPVYDEPEFVVRNVWRCYGGWYDGNPAHLKPPPDSLLAREIAGLAGGTDLLVQRASALAEAGELRLACALVEMATQASPEDRAAHAARAEIYRLRRKRELSLMAKGIYRFAERESQAIARSAASPPQRSS